jgi:hypothetical protein
MEKDKAIEDLEKTDIFDPKLVEKIINYLSIEKSESFPENPIKNSLHMNYSGLVFIFDGSEWLEVDLIKNTEDFPGFEENAGIFSQN